MSPFGSGELKNKKIILYDKKLNKERVVQQKALHKHSETYYFCPNCGENLVPYDYNLKDMFSTGMQRQHFCSECCYPILWY